MIKIFLNIKRYEKYDVILIIKNHDNVYECFLDTLYTCNIGQRASREGRLLLSTSSWINLAGIRVFWFTPLLHCFESYLRKLTQLINYFIHLLIRANRYAARVANVLRDRYEYLYKVLRKFRATLKINFSHKTCILFVKRNLFFIQISSGLRKE